jgi:hypothetical protein
MVSEDLAPEAGAASGFPDAAGVPEPPDEPDPPAVEAFRQAVDDAVADRLTAEAVEARLERLTQAVNRQSGFPGEDLDSLVESLARYAYQVVASWFMIIFDAGRADQPASDSAVTDRDVDDLACDTVARAVVGFREELARIRPWLDGAVRDPKQLFLQECLLQLSDAYQRWLRETDRISWDEAEQIGADSQVAHPAQLLPHLVDQVRNDRERVVYRLQRAGLPGAGRRATEFSEVAAAEIVDATLETLRAAARDWRTEGSDQR